MAKESNTTAQLQIPLETTTNGDTTVTSDGSLTRVTLPADATTTPATTETPQRPEWLPEGFDTPEALAEAYKALKEPAKLETKPAAKTPETLQIPKPEDITAKGVDLDALAKEYRENDGALTDATLTALEAKGIPKAAVQAYIDGQVARGQQVITEAAQHVGGVERMQNILNWAATGLSQDDQAAYNALLATGDANTMKVALDGLNAKMTLALGSDPQVTLDGEGIPPSSGVKPYASRAEVVADMAKKEYDTNPAFRKKVEARLAVSNVF